MQASPGAKQRIDKHCNFTKQITKHLLNVILKSIYPSKKIFVRIHSTTREACGLKPDQKSISQMPDVN